MKNQNPNSADEDSPRTWGRRQFLAAGATMLAAPLLSGVTVRAQSRETGAPAAAASPSSTPLGSGNGPYPTHVLAWGRWSTHVGIALSAFGEPKTTARTATRRLMPRKTVTEPLLKAAIRNSSSLTKISSSEFRIQSTFPKRD